MNSSLILILFFTLSACVNVNENMQVVETLKKNATTSATAGIGFNQIKSIFESKCLMCHNGSTHPKDWTDYETAKANLSKLNGRIFILGNMPAVGSLSATQKTTIKTWIDEGGPLLAAAGESADALPPESTAPLPTDPGERILNAKCLGCHGSDGIGLKSPLIHGQNKEYMIVQLKNFKSLARTDLIMGSMNIIANSLSDIDIENVADFLANKSGCDINVDVNPLTGNVSAGEVLAQDERFFCTVCHGGVFTGPPNFNLTSPTLNGQKTGYIKDNLMNFKTGHRTYGMMNYYADLLTEEEINNLAAYFNSKRVCP